MELPKLGITAIDCVMCQTGGRATGAQAGAVLGQSLLRPARGTLKACHRRYSHWAARADIAVSARLLTGFPYAFYAGFPSPTRRCPKCATGTCCRERQRNTRTLRSFGAKRSQRMLARGPMSSHVLRRQCELYARRQLVVCHMIDGIVSLCTHVAR